MQQSADTIAIIHSVANLNLQQIGMINPFNPPVCLTFLG